MSLGKSGISVDTRESITVELKPYCFFSKDDHFVEVCRWSNGEGFDISFSKSDKNISLTQGEWDAIQVAILYQAPKKEEK